jgi:hypothetical protein
MIQAEFFDDLVKTRSIDLHPVLRVLEAAPNINFLKIVAQK